MLCSEVIHFDEPSHGKNSSYLMLPKHDAVLDLKLLSLYLVIHNTDSQVWYAPTGERGGEDRNAAQLLKIFHVIIFHNS
jgi:hypothetical protein